ncbi:MAG: lipoprotein [Pseudomonadota bacterium]|nr:lipoprotein [Pseudomonadota bacterium]
MSASRTALGIVLIALALLAGCGQKGPLYMPGDEQAAEQYDPADAYQDQEESPAQPRPQEEGADDGDNADNVTTGGNAAPSEAGE